MFKNASVANANAELLILHLIGGKGEGETLHCMVKLDAVLVIMPQRMKAQMVIAMNSCSLHVPDKSILLLLSG